jgi:sulfatase modifying factor 1
MQRGSVRGAAELLRSPADLRPQRQRELLRDAAYPATLSDFWLDRFEVTVGRFRRFVASYPGNRPAEGAGAHPHIAHSGWQKIWNDYYLLGGKPGLTKSVSCNAATQTWTDSVGENENKPMNCLGWHEAFAFCVWDAGRLPTEAEWNYAAAGGSEQRAYPWSDPPSSTTIDSTYAVYDGASIGGVGSTSPKGDGRWGQADLAGSLWEWNLDRYDSYPPSCKDCATVPTASPTDRVIRGGNWGNPAPVLLSSIRRNLVPTWHASTIGVRCARNP